MGSPVLGCELEEIKKASFEASIIFFKSGGGGGIEKRLKH